MTISVVLSGSGFFWPFLAWFGPLINSWGMTLDFFYFLTSLSIPPNARASLIKKKRWRWQWNARPDLIKKRCGELLSIGATLHLAAPGRVHWPHRSPLFCNYHLPKTRQVANSWCFSHPNLSFLLKSMWKMVLSNQWHREGVPKKKLLFFWILSKLPPLPT